MGKDGVVQLEDLNWSLSYNGRGVGVTLTEGRADIYDGIQASNRWIRAWSAFSGSQGTAGSRVSGGGPPNDALGSGRRLRKAAVEIGGGGCGLSSRLNAAMEKNPWWKNVEGPFPAWQGPVGVKEDGGGCTRGRGTVGKMIIHRAVCNRDKDAIMKAVDAGEDVNEVEAAGNTPLHNAAYEGWLEGAELLLNLGARVNASNNAGDRPWHWAQNMGHTEMMDFLQKNGGMQDKGFVLVQEHIPKVKDFFQKECWQHHPKPYADFMDWRAKQDKQLEEEQKKIIRV